MNILGLTLSNTGHGRLKSICDYYGLEYSAVYTYLSKRPINFPISEAIALFMSKQPTLRKLCTKNNVKYEDVLIFKYINKYGDFSNIKLIRLYKNSLKPKKKPRSYKLRVNYPVEIDSLYKICKALDLSYSSVSYYKKKHPEMSEEDIVLRFMDKQYGHLYNESNTQDDKVLIDDVLRGYSIKMKHKHTYNKSNTKDDKVLIDDLFREYSIKMNHNDKK